MKESHRQWNRLRRSSWRETTDDGIGRNGPSVEETAVQVMELGRAAMLLGAGGWGLGEVRSKGVTGGLRVCVRGDHTSEKSGCRYGDIEKEF